mgnify:CR=1 FL=1
MINERIINGKAIIYGRFQPLTKSHYNMINKVLNEYNEVFVVVVQGEKAYKSDKKTKRGIDSDLKRKIERNPFPVGLRVDLILKAFPQLDNRHVIRAKRGDIEEIVENVLKRLYPKKEYSNIDIFAGEDEYLDYVRQAERYSKNTGYNINVIKYDEGTRVIDEKGNLVSEVSGTALRKALQLPDEKESYSKYKELIAPPLSDYNTFKKLRDFINKLNEERVFLNLFNNLSEELAKELKKQGYSINKKDSDYNEIELEIGSKVELEHTNDINAAKEIAKDHLEEDPLYYTKSLPKVDKEAKEIALKVLKKYGYNSIEQYLEGKDD